MKLWDDLAIVEQMAVTAAVLAYLVCIVVLGVGIVRDQELSAREACVGVVIVAGVPFFGAMLWITLWADRSWRIFASRTARHAPTIPQHHD